VYLCTRATPDKVISVGIFMKLVVLALAILCFQIGYTQSAEDERIAIQFFQLREYDKAEVLLKKQFEINPSKSYDYLFTTYIRLKKYEEAIAITKTMLKGAQSKNIDYRFKLGYAYHKNNDSINAKKEWLQTNELISDNEFQALSIINQYTELRQWNMAEAAILRFQSKANNKDALSSQLLNVYLSQKKYNDAVDLAIHFIDKTEDNSVGMLSSFQFLTENVEAMHILEKKIYSRLSANPNSEKWNGIAMWLSINLKDYEQALMLAKSFEKRNNSKGDQVFQIAEIAYNEEEYDVAIDGFGYLSDMVGSPLSKLGYEKKIKSIYVKIQKSFSQDSSSISQLNQAFLNYFSKYNFDHSTTEIQLLYADFNVKYLHRLDNAMVILKKMLDLPLLAKHYRSRGKIDLGDIKLYMNDIWEASLLYGQVDKDENDSPLGEEARFKNSKIFYFNGDYELASELLTILKSSTTELIANDALYLAVFIQDNLDGDTLEMAMKDISSAELFFYQNKEKEAFELINSVQKIFPRSSLIDDILMLEANYALKKGNFTEASSKFKQIVEKYPSSILADKALYELSKIEEKNKNSAVAIEGYLKLLTKYKDSVYTADARKRLRHLRGEKLEDEE